LNENENIITDDIDDLLDDTEPGSNVDNMKNNDKNGEDDEWGW